MTASVHVAESDTDVSAYLTLLSRLAQGNGLDMAHSALVDEAVEIWSKPGFDTMLASPRLAFEPFDYQLSTAQTVLRRMRGRAILADEVGLGKTIEAGLVLAELRMRGLADRVLVLTPAGLVEQWREELERKFALPTCVVANGRTDPADTDAASDRPVRLASIAVARREPLRGTLVDRQWDLVIADEAHRLRNPRSASGKLVRGLRTRYLLLLTATPVENKLADLYELVSLVAPGLLGTPAQFRAKHGAASADPAKPRNIGELRARTREVMVRHRRSEVALMLPQRLAETVLVTPGADEAGLYADIIRRVREAGRDAGPSRRLTLRQLTRLAGSSPAAAAPTLDKLGWTDLGEQARAIQAPEKVQVLTETLRKQVDAGEQVLVFTGFRKTLDIIAAEADRAGLPAVVYDGSLSRREKDAVIARFRDDVPVLLSTESAGEGRNLQFCHAMINMDLPWNPMQIEQRLGRLHRVGQQHDVTLTNLVARGSIEQRVMHVLEAKINLFELVVGELDMILGKVDDDFDFESEVFDAFLGATDDGEFERRLAELGDALTAARSEYLRSRQTVDGFVGEGE